MTSSPQAGRPSTEAVIAVFPDRDILERAIEDLLSNGFNQAQVSLVTADRTVAELKQQASLPQSQTAEAIDRSDTGNVQGLLSGIPTYLAGVLAAGVTVASGGALAGVALATLGGGAAGGLLGASAARYFSNAVDQRYDEQLARGGIVTVVSANDAVQAEVAADRLRRNGATEVGRTRFEDAPTREAEVAEGAVDSSAWTG